MEGQAVLMKGRVRRLGYVKWISIAVLLITVMFGSTVFIAQKELMEEREHEREELLEQQKQLEQKKARLELLNQYMDTEAYAEYYARYRLGYIKPNEMRFEE